MKNLVIIQFPLILFSFLDLSHGALEVVSNNKDIGCFVPGECINSNSVGVSELDTPDQCLASCKETGSCLYFTHYQDSSLCTLFSDCVELSDANCADCVSGDAACNEPGKSIVFIAGGSDDIGFHYQYNVEVKELKDDGTVCDAIPDVAISSLFVTANTVNGKAVFCGGDITLKDCFVFNPESLLWDSFAPLINNRSTHASVQLSEDSFLLTGGYGLDSESSSEYYDASSDSFVEGPELPDKFYRHCAAKLGDTIVIGGGENSTRFEFYMLDWESQTWTEMPHLPNGRFNHRCEIIDTVNGKELWVIGGIGFFGTSDEVDIFNFDSMTWSTGVPLPGPRDGFATVVVDNNIVVIGGQKRVIGVTVSRMLEWNPASNNWVELDVRMDHPRDFFGATLVDERSGVVC